MQRLFYLLAAATGFAGAFPGMAAAASWLAAADAGAATAEAATAGVEGRRLNTLELEDCPKLP